MGQSTEDKKDSLSSRLIAIRRDLHCYPESGWQEYRTSVRIIEHLEEWGVKYQFGKEILDPKIRRGCPNEQEDKKAIKRAVKETKRSDLIAKMEGGFTGVIARIEGEKRSSEKRPVFLLRFDMDANEIQECTSEEHRPYKEGFVSLHDGIMHACGHDGHVAIGLGVIKQLQENRDLFHAEIRILFQPAEEGVRGAAAFAKTNLTQGVDYMLSGHIGLNANRLGMFAAATTEFLATTKMKVSFYGKASHAGNCPQEGKNALAAACNATLNILGISRHSEGDSRVNVGALRADGPANIIPDYAELVLETRGSTNEVNQYMQKRVETICEGAAEMEGCKHKLEIIGEAGCASCNTELAAFVVQQAKANPFFDQIVDELEFHASEDVTELLNAVHGQGGKATYMLFGTSLSAPHHNDCFDFDEGVLEPAAELFFQCILELCKKKEISQLIPKKN